MTNTSRDYALDRLAENAEIIREAEATIESYVVNARTLGASWADIAISLGVSKQSAWERYRASAHD